MKNKLVVIGSLVVLLVFGFIYSQNNNLIADDKDGKKDCSSSCTKSSSTENKSQSADQNMSGATPTDDKSGYAVYEFVTDKISGDACKQGMTENIMGIAGVKEVDYGQTCNVSHMTNIKVYFSGSDTTPEIIAASVKEKGLQGNCGDGTKCTSKTKTQKKS